MACVIVTSDKCYENQEWDFAYREDDAVLHTVEWYRAQLSEEQIDAYLRTGPLAA